MEDLYIMEYILCYNAKTQNGLHEQSCRPLSFFEALVQAIIVLQLKSVLELQLTVQKV